MRWQESFAQLGNTQVESRFADHRTYIFEGKEVDQQTHLGFDLASTQQAPVTAANRGVVVHAAYLGIYGNCVIVDHGLGVQSLYAHLSTMDVKDGDAVEKGQTLGRSGTTGLAGGDHLHFTMLVGGVQVNPVEWWDPHWMEDRVFRKIREAGGTAPGGGRTVGTRRWSRMTAAYSSGDRARGGAVGRGLRRHDASAGGHRHDDRSRPRPARCAARVTLEGPPPAAHDGAHGRRQDLRDVRARRGAAGRHLRRRRRRRTSPTSSSTSPAASNGHSFPVPQEPVVLDQQKCWYDAARRRRAGRAAVPGAELGSAAAQRAGRTRR